MFGAKLNARIDGRVHDDAARERLVGVDAQLEFFAQTVGELLKIIRCSRDGGEPARAFEREATRGEALSRQQRRHIAALRRASGMQRLAHGTEHLTDPRRLGRGQPDGIRHFFRIELEQLANTRRRTEHADRAGAVPTGIVVGRVGGVADP